MWGDPQLLASGLAFSLPLLLILLAHELGHYLWCRHYRLPATAPLFLPAPFGFGTLGAFIRIRAPLRDRRQLLDVGAGGPIAGFVVLLPFLLYGIAHSRPAAIEPVAPAVANSLLYRPGSSLLMEIAVWLFHGPLPRDAVLDLHPFALAAWAGLLATSINLLPVGQLDGGHILYAAAGRRQRPVAVLLWILMAAAGFLWPGWWLLALLVLIFGLRHPPVLDESVQLDRRRRLVAWVALAILVLSFMPAPVEVFFLAS